MIDDVPVDAAHLLADEFITDMIEPRAAAAQLTHDQINSKYVKGEVRIVTEQARYPINTIAKIVDDPSYKMAPEYQRRHRWSIGQKSRLIESLIMNVPVPPIFLYEFDYSKYEVMDGLQRLSAINEFYRDQYALEDLEEWQELNGLTYSALPEKVREGVDRRYISSVILLKETAYTEEDALRLKQLVFERINSGGVKLSHQESRNAIFDGPLNQLCLNLSKNRSLCRLWGIPEATDAEIGGGAASDDRVQNDLFREMTDVELVLRFFAYRQKHRLHRSGESLSSYFDRFLRRGNFLPVATVDAMKVLFEQTILLAEDLLGEHAFHLYRKRTRGGEDHWSWLGRATITAYDPLMRVLSDFLPSRETLVGKADIIQADIVSMYKDQYEIFEGRNVNPAALQKREEAYRNFFVQYV